MAAEIFNDLPRATNANGVPVDGAQWFFYATGTTTPQAVFADAALASSLGAVVTADSGGQFVPVYFDATKTYRGVLKTPSGSTLRDIDPVNAGALSALSSAIGAGLIGVSTTEDYPTNTVGSSLNRFFNFTNPTFELQSLGPVVPANGVYIGAGGNALSFQNLMSNPSGGADSDNQRATMILRATTSDDGNSQEQTLQILTTIETGYAGPWTASTAFAAGANIRNVATNNVYRCTTAGTSAASGTGPSGKGSSIVDGTAVWTWINDSAINSKASIYNEVDVLAGAGDSWAQAHNLEVRAGVQAGTVFNTELDFTNNCGVDSVAGGLDKYCLALYMGGANRSTAALQIAENGILGVGDKSCLWGLKFDGANLASSAVIGIDASAANGISFGIAGGGVATPTFTNSVINDESIAVKALSLAGTYSSSAIEITGTTPAGVVTTGTKNLASLFDTATTPRGIILAGTYAKSPIQMATLPPSYADDAAAASGGLAVGDVYRTGSTLKVRVA